MPKPKKEVNKPYHWNVIKFKDIGGNGLKGITKYDQAFLEELDLNSIKNTDLQKASLIEFCQEKKLPYKVMLAGKDLTDHKILYEPGKPK